MSETTAINWSDKTGGEIYDYFFAKGVKLGLLANKLIRELKRKKCFTESCSKILAKKKEDKIIQRVSFANINPERLQYLQSEMSKPANHTDNSDVDEASTLEPSDISANLRARAMHFST